MQQIFGDRNNLILSIALGLIVILSLIFVIHPLASKFRNTYKDYLDKNAELQSLEKKYAELEKLEDIEDEIIQANENFLKFIPNQQESEDMMVTLDALARQTSNNLPNFSVAAETKDTKTSGRIAKKTLDITLEGSFANVLNFIQKAENLQRFNQINSLSISTSTNAENNISANLTLSIFYQK